MRPTSESQDADVPQNKYLQLVHHQATTRPSDQFCCWLDDKMVETDSRTFGEIWSRAGAVSNTLKRAGVVHGDRVIICFNFGLDFLDAFLGCLRFGAIAVPVYPPNPAKLKEALHKLSMVVSDCQSRFGLMDNSVNRLRASTRGWPTGITWAVPSATMTPAESSLCELNRGPRRDEDVAFLQYTSGSTGDPKGVMLSFGNIYHNMLLANHVCPHLADEHAIGCSWLPQFHDMGLLFCTLYPLARGRRQIFLSPTSFIKQPTIWLSALSKYRCTWTIVPNFAYGLAARKYLAIPAAKQPQLDLSSVMVFGNAAEPVRRETMVEFLQAFKQHGVLTNAHFHPSYGLAEHTVSCTTVAYPLEADPELRFVSDRNKKVVRSGDMSLCLAKAGDKHGLDLRIVDADGREVEDGQVGEIWLRSASCGKGYWGMPERSAETFQATLTSPRTPILDLDGLDPAVPPCFLRTGDEGFIEEDELEGKRQLFVCGRIKDLIIVRGKNVYPQDVELTGEQAACGLLRLNCSAAFQSHLPDGGGELDAADMVCEVKQRGIPAGQLAAACEAMAASIRAEHALRLRKLVLLVPRSVPKTTSGKIRRKEARRVLESGALMKRALMVWEDAGVEPTRRSNCDGDGEGGDDGLGEEVDELVEVEDKSFGSFLKVTLAESCLATGIEEEKVDVDVHSPAEMGIESVAAATLCQRLSVRLGTEVSAEAIITAGSIRQLATQLHAARHAAISEEGEGPEIPLDGQQHMGSLLRCPRVPVGLEDGPRAEVPGGGVTEIPLEEEERAQREGRSEEEGERKVGKEGGSVRKRGAESASSASTLAICSRVLVQLLLIFWLLLSLYLCAVPAVAVMERITDLQIFPLFLFRSLIEPKPLDIAVYRPWGPGNLFSVADFATDPPPPLISNPALAVPVALICAAGSFMLCFTAYVVVLKWVVLGRVRPGQYALWGFLYWRRWLVQRHIELLLLILSPVLQDAFPLSLLYTLLGASIGWHSKATFFALADVDFDLIHIGARASVSGSASLITAVVSGSTLYLRRIKVGEACDVCDGAALCPGTSLPTRTKVETHAVVLAETLACGSEGKNIRGRPALEYDDSEPFAGCSGSGIFDEIVMPTAWLVCMLVQAAVCVLPVVALHEFGLPGLQLSGLATICIALADFTVYLLSLCAFTVAAKWILLGRCLKVGARVRKHSALEVARECVLRLQGLVVRFVLMNCWGGVCTNLWFRAMGARIGPGTIFSLGVSLSDWDSVEIGAMTLLGGGCALKTAATCPETGDLLVVGVRIGEAVTCGANAVVGAGSHLGERVLVTTLSHVHEGSAVPPHSVVTANKVKTNERRCYVPRGGLAYSPPLLKELAIWVVYIAWTILAVWLALYAVWWLRVRWSWPALVLFPLGGGTYQFLQLVLVILIKQTIGRERRCKGTEDDPEIELHRFSDFCRIYWAMFTYMAVDASMLGQSIKGGPLFNLYLNSLRSNIHLNAFIQATWIYDLEQVHVGDGAAVNSLATLSPHIVLACSTARLHRLVVDPGATIWPRAALFGRTHVPASHVGPISRMAQTSTALALEELERRTREEGTLMPARVLVGLPATCHVASGLVDSEAPRHARSAAPEDAETLGAAAMV